MYSKITRLCLAAVTVKTVNCKDDKSHYKCRPSDLPVYEPLQSFDKPKLKKPPPEDSPLRKAIEAGICAVRVEVCKGVNAVAPVKNVTDFVNSSKERSKLIFDYLHEPENSLPRIGAIAGGGVSGFILGLRGGLIRRMFYSSLGSAAIASVFYPEKVKELPQSCFTETKKAAEFVYKYAVDVKSEDNNVNSSNWPKFPNFSKISKSIFDLAKSVKDTLFSSEK